LVRFVGSHGNALELLELAEKVLDEMAPFVEFAIERQGSGASWVLRDDDLGAARIEIGNDGITVEGLVGNETTELDAFDQRRDADRVEAMAGQEFEAHKIAERVGEGQDLGGQAPLGAAYGLAFSPPFAPCPWRWTLTMVASTMAYSRSGSSEQA
jgi:hypothetical protein